jgi:hypothetical protein
MGVLDRFSEDTEYFPGSNRPVVREPAAPKDETAWDAKPKVYVVAGREVEFFTVGMLARALHREAVTIRKWEREGIIPKATYRGQSVDPRGKRRLYTRDQVEGMLKIAWAEGLMSGRKVQIRRTQFTKRVVDLFKSLGGPA